MCICDSIVLSMDDTIKPFTNKTYTRSVLN